MRTIVLAVLVSTISAQALSADGYDPTWPQRAIDSGWQPPADLIRAAVFTSLDPPRITAECNLGYALAQIVPGSTYDIVTVEGLPSSQYKIETAYYGRVAPINGRWINVQNRGVQVRGATSAGTQHFKLVYSRPGGLDFDLGAPIKVYEAQDFYLSTTCK